LVEQEPSRMSFIYQQLRKEMIGNRK